MKSRNYAGISLLASLAACNSATAETVQKNSTQDPQKPNVIVILADDLGYGDLKCYGAKNVETPHVDKLASEGIRFTNAHTVAATSTPSRYSLLTGEYAWRRPDTDIAAGDVKMIIRPEQYTMADMFKSAGYATAAIGKWHLGLGDKTGGQDWNAPLPAALALDQLGLTENTLIILSSDNGPVVDDGYKDKAEELLNGHTPSGPWRGNKYSAFEGGTAVPVIVRWPQKIKKTGDSDVLMSQIDWLASLGALINARLPKGSAPDSYDRLGNLIGTDKTDRPWIVEQSMNHTLSVRTKDWKYIEPNDDPTTFMKAEKIETGNLNVPQLYEMEKVSEQENVAEKYPEKVFELQTILRQVRNKRIKM